MNLPKFTADASLLSRATATARGGESMAPVDLVRPATSFANCLRFCQEVGGANCSSFCKCVAAGRTDCTMQ